MTQRDDDLTNRIAAILDKGWPTRFALEGACRHGLRVRSILLGQSWQVADAWAAAVVETALHSLGMSRPTWAEGQPEFVDMERYQCGGCGGPLDLGNRLPWCCEECRTIVRAKRLRGTGIEHQAMWAAARAARAHGIEPVRRCVWCDQAFAVPANNGAKLYCGFECSRAAQKLTQPKLTCEHCQNPFTPRTTIESKARKFCSRECYSAGSRKARLPRHCLHCGSQFFPREPSNPKRFCSPRCSARNRAAAA